MSEKRGKARLVNWGFKLEFLNTTLSFIQIKPVSTKMSKPEKAHQPPTVSEHPKPQPKHPMLAIRMSSITATLSSITELAARRSSSVTFVW